MSKLVEIVGRILWRGSLELLEHLHKAPSKDPEQEKKPLNPEIEKVILEEPKIIQKSPIVAEVLSKLPFNGPRILRLSDSLYFARQIKTTTFCNKADFKGEWYTNGTNSPYPKVHRDKMNGLLGVSLPYPISRTRVVSPINPKTGLIHSYPQVDAGPGWVDDPYWITGTDPKNEKGKDYLGNPTALAGLDFWPSVWEDMGLSTFTDAFNGELSGVFDILIFDPPKVTTSKVSGNEIPSKDPRPWVSELPDIGSEFFSWRELLRGWNVSSKPGESQIQNLRTLVTTIMDPARKALGRLRVGSGLRDKETNTKVGGREGSFHLYGRAVDLTPLDVSFKTLYEWLTAHLKSNLRENVWENPDQDNEHVHLAVKLKSDEPSNIRIKK